MRVRCSVHVVYDLVLQFTYGDDGLSPECMEVSRKVALPREKPVDVSDETLLQRDTSYRTLFD